MEWFASVGAVYEGPDGIRRYFTDVEDAVPDLRLDLERLDAIGPDRVIASLRSRASGRASGIDIDYPVTNVYDLDRGRITRVRIVLARRQALDAVGLRE